MTTIAPRLRELDEMVVYLKGLVLVRDSRKRDDADAEELAMYEDEIRRLRERLAIFVKNRMAA